MENFHPIFKLHIRCFGIQGTPKKMNCHYFFQEGGGSSLDHLFIIYVVIMASGGRGLNPICTFSLNKFHVQQSQAQIEIHLKFT